MIVEYYDDVIHLSGALRSNFWETIHTTISLLLKRHPTGVIIDCSGIQECTPEGAETFHDALKFVREHEGARIVVVAVPPAMQEVLKTVPEVRSQLPISKTIEEARRSLDLLVAQSDKQPKRRQSPSGRKVLACIDGSESDPHVLDVAKELAGDGGMIILLFPILVPRNLPLQAAMPADEELATRAIAAARAFLKAPEHNPEVVVERTRELSAAVAEVADELAIARVVLAVPEDSMGVDRCTKRIRNVLERVTQPVLFVRGPKSVAVV